MAARSSTRREPQIELRKLTEDYCEFLLKNTDVSMANALRRIILVEVRGAAEGSSTARGQRAMAVQACDELACFASRFAAAGTSVQNTADCLLRRCPPSRLSWLSLRQTQRCACCALLHW